MTNPPQGISTAISRANVAEVVVQALKTDNVINKAFNLISEAEDNLSTSITTDFTALFIHTAPRF